MKKTKKAPSAARAAKRAPRASRPGNATHRTATGMPMPAIGAGLIVAAAVCIVAFVGAIALVPSRETARKADAVTVDDAPAGRPAAQNQKAGPEAPRAAVSDVKSDVKKVAGPKTATDPVRTAPVEPVGALVADSAPAVAAPEPMPARSVEHVASAVTITGCLEQQNDAFWLKDTEGADAPTSRSWKSGFLKKRPSRIEIVDPNNALKLPAYVGRRIAATGTLVNREMQPRSLHPLGASCS